MEIAITGATGFVGTNLKKYLAANYEINPISVRFIPNQELNINGDAIIHLAGKAHDLKKVSQPNEYYEANHALTKQLFDAFLESNSKTFIFISSVKAAADVVEGRLTEEVVSQPITPYGKSKKMAEDYILSQTIPEGKKVYILRPCMIHCPENKGNLNLLYQLVSKGIPWPLGAFENRRSFLSVENLCFVIKELLIQETIPSGVYNVADDQSLSTNELIQLMAQSQNKAARIFNISKGGISTIAKMGDFLRLPLNSERLQKLTESFEVSNSKIRKAIGKSFPVDAKQGLLTTFESLKK